MRTILPCIALVMLTSDPASAQLGHPKPVDDAPVVRADRRDIGLFFRFGGLSTLSLNTDDQIRVGEQFFSHVGVKFAITDRWMLPVYFGTGLYTVDAQDRPSTTDWGMEMGGGFEYHFRIWRRISPFVGAGVGLGFADPTGSENFVFSFTMGPSLGVEYYWGDRVSLTAQYTFIVQLLHANSPSASMEHSDFGFSTKTGGSMTLTYYF